MTNNTQQNDKNLYLQGELLENLRKIGVQEKSFHLARVTTCKATGNKYPTLSRRILLSLQGWVKTPSFSWLLLASHCILREWQNIEKAVTQFFDFMYI